MQELTAFGLIQKGLVNETPAVPTYQVKKLPRNFDDFEQIDLFQIVFTHDY